MGLDRLLIDLADGVLLEGDAFIDRDDVDVEVKHGLAGRGFVKLDDADAIGREGRFGRIRAGCGRALWG